MSSTVLTLPVEGVAVEAVQAILQLPEAHPSGLAILLGHGAGAPMDSEFMNWASDGLAMQGHAVLRFRYAYMERAAREDRRFPPDRTPKLELVHRAALEWLRKQPFAERIVLAGKSMGGRMSSHLAAAGEECAGLFYLGYPLHPAGKPEKLRSEHFPRIAAPSLFLQGTRDALCDLELLDRELQRHAAPWELARIEGGDHSFAVLKRSGRTEEDVREEILNHLGRWLRALQ